AAGLRTSHLLFANALNVVGSQPVAGPCCRHVASVRWITVTIAAIVTSLPDGITPHRQHERYITCTPPHAVARSLACSGRRACQERSPHPHRLDHAGLAGHLRDSPEPRGGPQNYLTYCSARGAARDEAR